MNHYEIHITVTTDNISSFKTVCSNINVKPIILDLQDQEGKTVLQDVMTSSTFRCDDKGAVDEVNRIRTELSIAGFQVIRTKIECSPFHPAVPNVENGIEIQPGNYFESHVRVLVNDETLLALRNMFKNSAVHVSRNIFKKVSDGQYKILLTLRSYTGTYEDFKNILDDLLIQLENFRYLVDKKEVEYILYDSNVMHDNKWIESYAISGQQSNKTTFQ